LLIAGGLGWWKQGYIKELHYWYDTMEPDVLAGSMERSLKPGEEFKECKSGCPTMVVVPAGHFMMGSKEHEPNGRPNERPAHPVTIAKPFAVGKFEVTVAEWQACVDAGACPSNDWTGLSDRPVSNVTWDDAGLYASWLWRMTGRSYRLLSEAEWEYAARANTATAYSFGDDQGALREYAWYEGNAQGKAHFVGQKKPNGFGLHDMHGNLAELTSDCFHSSYDGAPSDGSSWKAASRPRQSPVATTVCFGGAPGRMLPMTCARLGAPCSPMTKVPITSASASRARWTGNLSLTRH
jgi:formylglycine-generating enzyme required for sulfatase activity